MTTVRDWQGTRAAGLEALAAFVPVMGRRYAAGRNYDYGPENRKAVSGLSPWVRRRLVTEQELVAAAIVAHGLDGAEKFIQEVFWRSYFKGWLERRPQVWRAYVEVSTPISPRSIATGGYAARWKPPRAARRGSPVSTPGRRNSWRPAICTTTRGCSSPRSGSSRSICPGG